MVKFANWLQIDWILALKTEKLNKYVDFNNRGHSLNDYHSQPWLVTVPKYI